MTVDREQLRSEGSRGPREIARFRGVQGEGVMTVDREQLRSEGSGVQGEGVMTVTASSFAQKIVGVPAKSPDFVGFKAS